MCAREPTVGRIKRKKAGMDAAEMGGLSLGSSRVTAKLTLEYMMTLFYMNDVHQGIQLNDTLRFLIS